MRTRWRVRAKGVHLKNPQPAAHSFGIASFCVLESIAVTSAVPRDAAAVLAKLRQMAGPDNAVNECLATPAVLLCC